MNHKSGIFQFNGKFCIMLLSLTLNGPFSISCNSKPNISKNPSESISTNPNKNIDNKYISNDLQKPPLFKQNSSAQEQGITQKNIDHINNLNYDLKKYENENQEKKVHIISLYPLDK